VPVAQTKKGVMRVATVKERIYELLRNKPGLTDAEIRRALNLSVHQHANNEARRMQSEGLIRRVEEEGLIRNYIVDPEVREVNGAVRPTKNPASYSNSNAPKTPEDDVKLNLGVWLEENGWDVSIVPGTEPGPDIVAKKGGDVWVIEVKGAGSRPQMRVNYFLSALGQILQRMNSGITLYSIAFPNLQQYRRLWQRLPSEAKRRTNVSALFVDAGGEVNEVR